jgi:peptide methionine sulfoxide reductase MsrA
MPTTSRKRSRNATSSSSTFKAFPADRDSVTAPEKFYPAEDYHQNFLALHPDEPYIVQ